MKRKEITYRKSSYDIYDITTVDIITKLYNNCKGTNFHSLSVEDTGYDDVGQLVIYYTRLETDEELNIRNRKQKLKKEKQERLKITREISERALLKKLKEKYEVQ